MTKDEAIAIAKMLVREVRSNVSHRHLTWYVRPLPIAGSDHWQVFVGLEWMGFGKCFTRPLDVLTADRWFGLLEERLAGLDYSGCLAA